MVRERPRRFIVIARARRARRDIPVANPPAPSCVALCVVVSALRQATFWPTFIVDRIRRKQFVPLFPLNRDSYIGRGPAAPPLPPV